VIQVLLSIPFSYLVICPGCFDIWARIQGDDHEYWRHRYVPCERHADAAFPYGCRLAGSLLELPQEELPLEALPQALLEREFTLTMSNLNLGD
jgi:hypothetical protein